MFKLLFTLLFFVSAHALAEPKLAQIFKNKKPIIGVVNLPNLPGQKNFTNMNEAVANALSEMTILEEEGVDGVIFENPDGDIPSNPETIAAMTVIVTKAMQKAKTIVVGVEVLWHDPLASLAIAKATGAKFIRTDFFADKMMADKQLINEKPKRITDYRTKIGADNVLILADVQVKYGVMIDKNKTMTQSVNDALAGKCDAVVVTGRKSGVPPEVDKVKEVKAATGLDNDVVLGSGTSVENVAELLSIADAAIVGTSISTKTGGVLVREKVRAYMDAVKKLR